MMKKEREILASKGNPSLLGPNFPIPAASFLWGTLSHTASLADPLGGNHPRKKKGPMTWKQIPARNA
jgi:hypothetical protein